MHQDQKMHHIDLESPPPAAASSPPAATSSPHELSPLQVFLICASVTGIVMLLIIIAFSIYYGVTGDFGRPPKYELLQLSLHSFNLSAQGSNHELTAAWNMTILCTNTIKHDQLAISKSTTIAVDYRQRAIAKTKYIPQQVYIPVHGSIEVNLTASVNGKTISPKTYHRMKEEIASKGGVNFEVVFSTEYYNDPPAYWSNPRLLPVP